MDKCICEGKKPWLCQPCKAGNTTRSRRPQNPPVCKHDKTMYQSCKKCKMKYKAWDLFEHITTRSDITCSSCGYNDYIYEAGEAEDFYFERGWRATKQGNIYCPNCAYKKLKLK